jgi:hypothetical protein
MLYYLATDQFVLEQIIIEMPIVSIAHSSVGQHIDS